MLLSLFKRWSLILFLVLPVSSGFYFIYFFVQPALKSRDGVFLAAHILFLVKKQKANGFFCTSDDFFFPFTHSIFGHSGESVAASQHDENHSHIPRFPEWTDSCWFHGSTTALCISIHPPPQNMALTGFRILWMICLMSNIWSLISI